MIITRMAEIAAATITGVSTMKELDAGDEALLSATVRRNTVDKEDFYQMDATM